MRWIALLFLPTIILLAACGGGQQESPVVPPKGIHVTVPADFPQSEEATLRQFALEPADLPPGLQLQYEDASDVQDGISYVAHYATTEGLSFDEGLAKASGPVTLDVSVVLYDHAPTASAFFRTLRSMSLDDVVQYTRTQSHWSAEDLGWVQEGVQADNFSIQRYGDDSFAWMVSETVRHPEMDTEMTIVDVSVYIRRGRAIGMVDIGTLNEPPETADLEALAAKLDQRLAKADQ
jgi:hypothetical protein